MFKKVHNINNPRKLIPAKKSLNGQTAKINTRNAIFFQKEKTAKISTIKVTFDKNYAAIHEIKPVLTLNKPIYVGFTILEVS